MSIGLPLATGWVAAYIRLPMQLQRAGQPPTDSAGAFLGMTDIITIIAAIIAALVAVMLLVLRQGAESRARKRLDCAKALADALAWLELPYRVRRKVDDKSLSQMASLADRAHELQEAHLLHESWLRIEVPEVYEIYISLLHAVREAAREPLRVAWEHPAIKDGKDMNIGGLDVPQVDSEVEAYTNAVQDALSPKFLGIY